MQLLRRHLDGLVLETGLPRSQQYRSVRLIILRTWDVHTRTTTRVRCRDPQVRNGSCLLGCELLEKVGRFLGLVAADFEYEVGLRKEEEHSFFANLGACV